MIPNARAQALPPAPPPSPTDAYGTTRNQYLGGGPGMEGILVSPREQIESEDATAKAHYEVMKKLPQDKRIDYLRRLSPGRDLESAASDFMNLVHRTPSKDPKAAAHGQSDRDYAMGPSDALVFFGSKIKKLPPLP